MCAQCIELWEKIVIHTPGEYFGILRQVREMMAERTLALVHGTVDLGVLALGKPWPADHIEHIFECSACGQRFRLAVETYHGAGGSWAPVD
jgi:hypothetical protein